MRWWHLLPVILVLLVNSVGLGLVYWRLNSPRTIASSPAEEALRVDTAEIADKLTRMQDQLTRLQPSDTATPVLGASASTSGQLSDLLPDIPNSTISTSVRYLSVSDNITNPVSVYKEQADFSPLIGQLIPGQKYPFTTAINSWYQVNLSGGTIGWVKADQVKQLP